jgi:hypothetical protein
MRAARLFLALNPLVERPAEDVRFGATALLQARGSYQKRLHAPK